MLVKERPKLTTSEIINHMKKQGIRFEIASEQEAYTFLTQNTYYFKIKAYKKIYDVYTENSEKRGQYINLDFAYLRELSTIDAAFRKFIIKASLDIEHFLKVQLLRHFDGNEKEDGYNIVNKYFERYGAKEEIAQRNNSYVCSGLIEKYKDDFAIWNIVEVLTFKQFIDLYELYFREYPCKESMVNMLMPIKFLRNAAAHNNCLLNRLKDFPEDGRITKEIQPNKKVMKFVSEIKSISALVRNSKLQNHVIHDFVTLIYVHERIVTSGKTKEHFHAELQELIERFFKHEEYFEKNQLIKSYWIFLKKVVDFVTSK